MGIPKVGIVPHDVILARWTGDDRPRFIRGKLIAENHSKHFFTSDGVVLSDPMVCRCPQGDVLHVAGVSDEDLHALDQEDADLMVAECLDISLSHSCLLREVNDKTTGNPEDVLRAPEKVIGEYVGQILAFWRHLDTLDGTEVPTGRLEPFPRNVVKGIPSHKDITYRQAYNSTHISFSGGQVCFSPLAARVVWEIFTQDVHRATGCKFQALPIFGFKDPSEIET